VKNRRTAVIFAATAIASAMCGATIIGAPNQPHHRTKTALTAYQKLVNDRIGQRWFVGVNKHKDSVVVGTLTMSFRIESDGRVTNLKIRSNTSNELFGTICTAAVLESKLPPLPDEVKRELHHDFLESGDMSFTLYPN
jgi:hypothetical protein